MIRIERAFVAVIVLALLLPSFSRAGQARDGTGTTVSEKILTISGSAGLSGVVLKGLPGSPITDATAGYAVAVPYGWAGKVTPDKEGYTFSPTFRQYPKIAYDLPGQDYKAEVRMLTISDRIMVGDEPIAEASITAEPGGYTTMTDSLGRYIIKVPYGWSGRVTVETGDGSKAVAAFGNVRSDYIDGRPVPSAGSPPSFLSRIPAPGRPVLPSPAGNVFVIPTAPVVPETVAETTEDLRIMLQILREKVTEPRMIRGAFMDFGSFFDDRNRALEAFHLQGSAAVFVLEMDAPFSPAAQPRSEDQVRPEAADPVWQRARQKLYAPPGQAIPGSPGAPGETREMDFQQFQEDLLQTLRHAANLRHVEPNEAVILTIVAREESAGWPGAGAGAGGSFSNRGGIWFEGGSDSSSSGTFGPSGGTSQADSRSYSRGSATSRARPGSDSAGVAAPSTVLTLQAKKADIDAFAQGDLNFEQFQHRVKTFTY